MTCLLCQFETVPGEDFCEACLAELERPVLLTVEGLAHQAKRLLERRIESVKAETARINRRLAGAA